MKKSLENELVVKNIKIIATINGISFTYSFPIQ